jgi:hypothetical protein
VLCAAQAATVAAPARQARPLGRSWLWLAVPATLLGAGVAIVNLVPQGDPRWWLWPPAAVGLWLVAWLTSGLVRDAAGTTLIALACLAAASAIAMVAPAWSIRVGLVCLAALDVVLVWATPSVREASNTLEQVQSPVAAGMSLPSLQQPAFGHAFMGWLDLLAPALLGVVVAGRTKLGAAAVTGIAAGLWGLLFYVTSEVAATVPVLAGLAFAAVDARRSRLRHPLEPARPGGGPRGDRSPGA